LTLQTYATLQGTKTKKGKNKMATPILTIHAQTVEILNSLSIPVNPATLLSLIKGNRAKSDIIVNHPTFNPELIVTGCNSRLIANYYNQLVNLAMPIFNPEINLEPVEPVKSAKKSNKK
jgi:hypothetical protein